MWLRTVNELRANRVNGWWVGTATVSSASSVERLALRAMMEYAQAEPIE